MNNINVTGQLELGFNHQRAVPARRRPTRAERAAWWFARMRTAVDNAIAWGTQSVPPPEQILLPQAQGSMRG